MLAFAPTTLLRPVLALIALSSFALAQIGGTGSDGPFLPDTDLTIDTTFHGGVYNFTVVNIPSWVTIRARGPNPLTILCSGQVTIQGTINVAGADGTFTAGGEAGAGGWAGGNPGQSGSGPGGGRGGMFPAGGGAGHAVAGIGALPGLGGPPYGSRDPVQQEGGSGGGGGQTAAGGGGGGGGAVWICADGPVVVAGTIVADGGNGYPQIGGGGSGGAVILRSASSVTVPGAGRLTARGGSGTGSYGFIRLDAYRSRPVLLPSATIDPSPLTLELPHLDVLTEPQVGQPFQLRTVSMPSDLVLLLLAAQGNYVDLGPLGIFKLSEASLMLLRWGTVAGRESRIEFPLPTPNDPSLAGVLLYWQSLSVRPAGVPDRLSNLLITQVRP